MTQNSEARWFGDREVDPAEKTHMVGEVFTSVASRYDVMNDIMSAGIHRMWKRRFIARIAPRPGEAVIDVAGGTGDIALKLAASGADVTVCDFTPAMVAVGRDRALDQGQPRVKWSVGNAQFLPFADNSFDAYTIAFGLRNVTEIDTALAEAYRVLRYGGRFFCLEFSKVTLPGFAQAYDLYSRFVIPMMGEIVARDRDSYQYLVESIRRFPSQSELALRMETAGFSHISIENLSGGIVAIHGARKI